MSVPFSRGEDEKEPPGTEKTQRKREGRGFFFVGCTLRFLDRGGCVARGGGGVGIPNRKRKKRLKVEEVGKKIKEEGKGRLEPDALVRIFLQIGFFVKKGGS